VQDQVVDVTIAIAVFALARLNDTEGEPNLPGRQVAADGQLDIGSEASFHTQYVQDQVVDVAITIEVGTSCSLARLIDSEGEPNPYRPPGRR
jgi:hypothetical protein